MNNSLPLTSSEQAQFTLDRLNAARTPAIFLITGLNSVGKTTFARELMRNFNFYQTIHLGVISKLLKLEYGYVLDELENSASVEFHQKYGVMLDELIAHYYKQGVNTIIEGVQIRPKKYATNPRITGGVILEADPLTLEEYGNKPDSRLGRKLKRAQLPAVEYEVNEKFIKIKNYNMSDTYEQIVNHMNACLDRQMTQIVSE